MGTILGATAVGTYKVGPEIQQVYYLGVYDPEQEVPTQVYRVTVHGQASFISGATFASGWVPASVIDSLGCRLHAAEASFSTHPRTPHITCSDAKESQASSKRDRSSPPPAASQKSKEPVTQAQAGDQDKQDTEPSQPSVELAKPATKSKTGMGQESPNAGKGAPSVPVSSETPVAPHDQDKQDKVEAPGTATKNPSVVDQRDKLQDQGRAVPRARMFTLGPDGVRESPQDHRLVIVMGSSADKFFEAIDQVLGDSAKPRKPPPLTTEQKERLVNELREAELAQIRLEDLRSQAKKNLVP